MSQRSLSPALCSVPEASPSPARRPQPPTANGTRSPRCESGGNWAINTGNGYQGGLQFSPGHLVRAWWRRIRARRAHGPRTSRSLRRARAGHPGPRRLAGVRYRPVGLDATQRAADAPQPLDNPDVHGQLPPPPPAALAAADAPPPDDPMAPDRLRPTHIAPLDAPLPDAPPPPPPAPDLPPPPDASRRWTPRRPMRRRLPRRHPICLRRRTPRSCRSMRRFPSTTARSWPTLPPPLRTHPRQIYRRPMLPLPMHRP